MNTNEFEKTQVVVEDLSKSPLSKATKLKSRKVVITGPILKKNCRQHKDINQSYGYLSRLVKNPDFICRNRRDSEVLVCYKKIKDIRKRFSQFNSLIPKIPSEGIGSGKEARKNNLQTTIKKTLSGGTPKSPQLFPPLP